MKITDLLALDHHAARKLAKAIEGAKELPTAPDAPLVEVSDALAARLYERAEELHTEAVRRRLLWSKYNIENWQLEREVVDAIARLTMIRHDPSNDPDIALLESLWSVLPKKYRKKTGKVLRVKGKTVTLILHAGKQKHTFTFPLSHFEQ